MPNLKLNRALVLLMSALSLAACAGSSKRPSTPAAVPTITAEKKVVLSEWTPELENCASPLDQAVHKFAATLPPPKPDKRLVEMSTFFDFVLPKTREEALRMNGMALFVIRLYASSVDELPMQKIYWAPEADRSKLFVLPPIFPRLPVFKINESKVNGLGKYRNDGFFFIPIELLTQKGELFAVLQGAAKPVRVTPLPAPGGKKLPKYLQPIPKPDAKKIPDPAFVVPLVIQRYCYG